MNLFLDSFWRAVAYCLHPRVILLSLLPLVLMAVLALGLGYFYWYPALDWVSSLLESSTVFNNVWSWLEGIGAGKVKVVAGPLIVIFAVTPVLPDTALMAFALASALPSAPVVDTPSLTDAPTLKPLIVTPPAVNAAVDVTVPADDVAE